MIIKLLEHYKSMSTPKNEQYSSTRVIHSFPQKIVTKQSLSASKIIYLKI